MDAEKSGNAGIGIWGFGSIPTTPANNPARGLPRLRLRFSRTLCDAVPQFDGGDRRYEHLGSLVRGFLKLGANRWRGSLDQGNASIGIQQVSSLEELASWGDWLVAAAPDHEPL